jgi:ankyrin repeat protein
MLLYQVSANLHTVGSLIQFAVLGAARRFHALLDMGMTCEIEDMAYILRPQDKPLAFSMLQYVLPKDRSLLSTPLNANGETVLHLAAMQYDPSICEWLLLTFPEIDVNIRTYAGKNPLMYACESVSDGVAMLLIAHGADIHAKDMHHTTILHYVAQAGPAFSSVYTLLQSRGASEEPFHKKGRYR